MNENRTYFSAIFHVGRIWRALVFLVVFFSVAGFTQTLQAQEKSQCLSSAEVVARENASGSNTIKTDPALTNILLMAFRVVTKNTVFDRFNDTDGALIIMRNDHKTVFVYFTKNDIACEGIETTQAGMKSIYEWMNQHPLDNGIPA